MGFAVVKTMAACYVVSSSHLAVYVTWWYIARRRVSLRIFRTKHFVRFQRKERIDDAALCHAIRRAERGLIDADLGHGLIKQRVARRGEGKSGGYRTIIAYRARIRSVFLYGFAKNRQANISKEDERDLKDYGAMILALDAGEIEIMLRGAELTETECYGEEK